MTHSHDAALSALMGTWTFFKEMEASRYYNVRAFVVIHFMPDPLQSLGCTIKKNCNIMDNKLCQREAQNQGDDETCVNTEKTIVEWSEVSALMQFGWEVGTGYYWRSTVAQNTTDWLGPYNIVFGNKQVFHNVTNTTSNSFVSRYVQTPATNYLHYPPKAKVTSKALFDHYAGATAVKSSIVTQRKLDRDTIDNDDDDDTTIDPYQNFTCPANKKDTINTDPWTPLLPRIELFPSPDETLHMKLDYDIFAFPQDAKKDPLYKVWPALATHFEKNQIKGPYCWNVDPTDGSDGGGSDDTQEKDALHGYSIPLSYDTRLTDNDNNNNNNNGWILHKSCHHEDHYPCWHDKHGNETIPVTPSSDGGYNMKLLLTYGCYFLGLAVIILLAFNCQLNKQLKRAQQESEERERRQQQQEDAPPMTQQQSVMLLDEEGGSLPPLVENNEAALREPLLAGNNSEGQQPQTQGVASGS